VLAAAEFALSLTVTDGANTRPIAPIAFSIGTLTLPKIVIQFPLFLVSNEPESSEHIRVPVLGGLDFGDDQVGFLLNDLVRIRRERRLF
jgi:hypothetical protein